MPATYLQFEVGKRYRDRLYEIEVLSRTARTATVRGDMIGTRRCKILTLHNDSVTEEYIRPLRCCEFRASNEVKAAVIP